MNGLLSAAELLALAHSAFNPLIYGMFSLKTMRRSCGHRCLRLRRMSPPIANEMTTLSSVIAPFCCCGAQTIADVSPDGWKLERNKLIVSRCYTQGFTHTRKEVVW